MAKFYIEPCTYANGTEPKDMDSPTSIGCGQDVPNVSWVDGQIGGDFTPLFLIQDNQIRTDGNAPGWIGASGDVALGDARYSFKLTRGGNGTGIGENHHFGARYFGDVGPNGPENSVYLSIICTSATQIEARITERVNDVQIGTASTTLISWGQGETKWAGFDIEGTTVTYWISDSSDFDERVVHGTYTITGLTAPSSGEGSICFFSRAQFGETELPIIDDLEVGDVIPVVVPLGRLDGLLAKVESVAGTYESMSASTDGVRLAERGWSKVVYDDLADHLRLGVASGSAVPATPAKTVCPLVIRVEIVVELRGLGSAYADGARQETDALLRACGMSATVDATGGAEKITYVAIDGPAHDTVSLELYAGGLKFEIAGCRGNFVLPVKAGRIGRGIFSMQGIMNSDPVVSTLPSITYDSTVPLAATSMSMSVGGWTSSAMKPESARFNLGSRVVAVPSANSTNGFKEIALPSHKPTFGVRAQSSVSDYEPFAVLAAGTTAALNVQLGSVRLNRVKLTESAAQVKPGGIRMLDLDGFTGFNIRYHSPAPTLVFD